MRLWVLTLALIQLCVGQKWTKEDYPNPVTNPETCRRPGVSRPRICDPDSLVDKSDLTKLEDIIKEISRSTVCPCGPVICSRSNDGYSVSIALVKRMKRERGADSSTKAKLQEARLFAEYLGRRSWNFSRCEDDVVILYSKDDSVLYIATGQKTQVKLTDDIVHNIVLHHQREFPGNMFNGLKSVLEKIQGTLKGEWPVQLPVKRLPDPPEDGGRSGTVGLTGVSILFIISPLASLLFN